MAFLTAGEPFIVKTCCACKRDLPLSSFYRSARGRQGVQAACKECNTAAQRAVPPEVRRDRWLRRTYGLSLADYEARLEAQAGVCAICHEPPTEIPLVVDHDHACCSGRRSCGACVRGLICDPCNRGLAAFRDDPERLLAASIYLKEIIK